MRGRSAVSTDLDGLYAAQRLTMVRLAALLVGDRDVAESVVQRAFLVLVRRHDRRADPGTAVAELRSQVVAGCRAVLRGRRDEPAPASVRDTADDVRTAATSAARGGRPRGVGAAEPAADGVHAAGRRAHGRRGSHVGTRRASPSGRAGGRHGDPRPRRRGARAAGRRHRRRRPPASVRGGPRRGRPADGTPASLVAGRRRGTHRRGCRGGRRHRRPALHRPVSHADSSSHSLRDADPAPTARSPPRRSHPGSRRAAPSRGPRSASAGP